MAPEPACSMSLPGMGANETLESANEGAELDEEGVVGDGDPVAVGVLSPPRLRKATSPTMRAMAAAIATGMTTRRCFQKPSRVGASPRGGGPGRLGAIGWGLGLTRTGWVSGSGAGGWPSLTADGWISSASGWIGATGGVMAAGIADGVSRMLRASCRSA
jgi:hypothetical protein